MESMVVERFSVISYSCYQLCNFILSFNFWTKKDFNMAKSGQRRFWPPNDKQIIPAHTTTIYKYRIEILPSDMAIVQFWRPRSHVMKFNFKKLILLLGVLCAENLLPSGLRCPRVEKVPEEKYTSQTRILNG